MKGDGCAMSTKEAASKGSTRESSIELLKVFALFMIVLSHVIQTLCQENGSVPYHDYVIDLNQATTDPQQFALSVFRYSGAFGNLIFILSSAWFLVDSDHFSPKKWFSMLTEVWALSVAVMLFSEIESGGGVSLSYAVKSLMPTTFGLNWFATAYLLIYPLHPVLNLVIHKLSQRQLFRISAALMMLYVGVGIVMPGRLFFSSSLVVWISLYFGVAYVKLYMPKAASSKKVNVALFTIGLVGEMGIMLLVNFLGLHIGYFSNKLLHWLSNGNPFLVMIAFSMFNIARGWHFQSRFVNKLSALSLIVYLLHEHPIMAIYYRPYAVNFVYENFGYDFVLLWMFLLSFLIFAGALAIGFLYKTIFGKAVDKLAEAVRRVCGMMWAKFEDMAMKVG